VRDPALLKVVQREGVELTDEWAIRTIGTGEPENAFRRIRDYMAVRDDRWNAHIPFPGEVEEEARSYRFHAIGPNAINPHCGMGEFI
jgi:hypothetical protein